MNPRWRKPAPAADSPLFANAWQLPGVGRVTLGSTRLQDLRALDETWLSVRPTGDPAEEWSWYDIGFESSDRFCLRDEQGAILALWAAERSGTHLIDDTKTYRLDRLEVHAQKRGLGIGGLVMGLIAKRAQEHRADAAILAAVPHERTLRFYERVGGVRGPVRGWKGGDDLIVFRFDSAALAALVKYADARQT